MPASSCSSAAIWAACARDCGFRPRTKAGCCGSAQLSRSADAAKPMALMPSAWLLLAAAGVLAASACTWVMRAYASAGDGAKPRPALLVCATAGLGALALYLAVGRPDLPDAPFAQRMEALRHRD